MDKNKKNVCCICGKEYEGFGNNAEPLIDFEEGRCCDDCNRRYVIRYRVQRVQFFDWMDKDLAERKQVKVEEGEQ